MREDAVGERLETAVFVQALVERGVDAKHLGVLAHRVERSADVALDEGRRRRLGDALDRLAVLAGDDVVIFRRLLGPASTHLGDVKKTTGLATETSARAGVLGPRPLANPRRRARQPVRRVLPAVSQRLGFRA